MPHFYLGSQKCQALEELSLLLLSFGQQQGLVFCNKFFLEKKIILFFTLPEKG